MPTIRMPSVQSLLIQMRFNGNNLSSGTAFVIQSKKGPVLVTNRHNLTGRHQETGQVLSKTGGTPNEISILHNQKNALGSWVEREEKILDRGGAPLWREHPSLQGNVDFVALPLTSINDIDLYPYNLADDGPDMEVGPADSVSVVGFPFGLQAGGSLAIWATGFMASEPDIDFGNLPRFLIDCRGRPGQSGSAVVAHRSAGGVKMKDGSTVHFGAPISKFLGIYSGRINSESDLGIVWKSTAIKQLVDSI